MKIISYKKKKNDLYEVTLSSNEKITIYDDVILKYELLLKKEIDKNLLKVVLLENSKIESYKVALKYLNSKLRTEEEIRKKLNKYNKDCIEYTISRLKDEGYLNNELYIKSYINDEINLKMVGPNKILYNLKRLGFKDSDILNYLDNIDKDVWLQKINKYINKKINSNHNLSSLMLKQKIIEDLLHKGFNKDDIYIIIDEYTFKDNEDILDKEYNKLKIKYSKKLSGEELEYKIKMELIRKGFQIKNSD